MGKAPTVWMRSIRYHTYQNRPQNEGDVYLAQEDIVETILALGFAVKDDPPKKATRKTPRA